MQKSKGSTHNLVLERREIANNLFRLMEKDERVNFVLTVGSTAKGTENELSDIDICIVMKDDNGLNQILREVNIIFPALGKLVGYYNYSPYHYYVVYDNCIPLDIYIISSSIYFVLRKSDNQIVVDHSRKNIGLPESSEQRAGLQVIVEELFLKSWIRTFRLLSKVKKGDFVTLIYILNQIREDQIIPLLSIVLGYNIPHSKAVKLEEFTDEIRELFIKTFSNPTLESTLNAIRATAELLRIIYASSRQNFYQVRLDHFVEDAYRKIVSHKTS